MNKILLISFTLISSIAFSQEEESKKLQAGLVFGSGLNFNKALTKRMTIDGAGNVLLVGLNFNYKLNQTIAFSSGFELGFENNYIKPSAVTTPSYYQFDDTKILQNDEAQANNKVFQVVERTQKPIYITIPTEMLFRTKYFGYLRYHGKFGLRTSVLASNKINDRGFVFEDNDITKNAIVAENTTMKAAQDMSVIRSSAGFSLGGEWNFSGSTSLSFEMGYYFGFVPIYNSTKEKNKTLYYYDETATKTYYSNDMSQNQLMLKIGLLF